MFFPKDFLWGVATSSHQIEGNDKNSDWWKYEEMGKIGDGVRSEIACDSWNKWKEDNEWIQKLGLNCYRFSISWSRIEPQKGEWNDGAIRHYGEIITDLKKRNIKVMLGLHHFVNPAWFTDEGGWEKKENVKYFVRFTDKLAREFGGKADYWVTINEPNCIVPPNFVEGKSISIGKSLVIATKVADNLISAHILAYEKIHEVLKSPKVGIVMALVKYEAGNPVLKPLVWLIDWLQNERYLTKINGKFDWFGVNYYSRVKIWWD